MRRFLLCLALTICATAVQAQEQESKMLDRMMRPNMELNNSAQNKKFTAVEGVSVDKKFQAKEFSAATAQTSKRFWGAKSFLSKTFGTGKYARAEAASNAKAAAELAYATTEFQTKQSALVRESSFARKSSKARDYADNRKFLAEGTRQKILDQENQAHPMSIDDVRELLNKGHK